MISVSGQSLPRQIALVGDGSWGCRQWPTRSGESLKTVGSVSPARWHAMEASQQMTPHSSTVVRSVKAANMNLPGLYCARPTKIALRCLYHISHRQRTLWATPPVAGRRLRVVGGTATSYPPAYHDKVYAVYRRNLNRLSLLPDSVTGPP